MRKTLFALAATACAALAAPASAAQYMFSFSGADLIKPGVTITGSGVFTTSDIATMVGGQTAFAITAITGMVDGSAIVAPTGFYGNYFTTGPAVLDGSGVRFNTAAVNNISFFNQSSNGKYRVNSIGSGKTAFVDTSFSAVTSPGAVPEPATWAMMIMGFGAIGLMARSDRRKAVPVHA
jgi:hypothetical protein